MVVSPPPDRQAYASAGMCRQHDCGNNEAKTDADNHGIGERIAREKPADTSLRSRATCNELPPSFVDDLVGDGEQVRRNAKAQRLGGFEVDH
jgi:hypothetical protein